MDSKTYYEKLEKCVTVSDYEKLLSLVSKELVKHDEKTAPNKKSAKMVEYMEDNSQLVFDRFFGDANVGENKKQKNIYMLKIANSLAKHLKINSTDLWSGYHEYMVKCWDKKEKHIKNTIKTLEDAKLSDEMLKAKQQQIDEFGW